jgi:hypothetical protein
MWSYLEYDGKTNLSRKRLCRTWGAGALELTYHVWGTTNLQLIRHRHYPPVTQSRRHVVPSPSRSLQCRLSRDNPVSLWGLGSASSPITLLWEVTYLGPKNGVFWVVTPCGSCKNRRFGGTWHLLHQGDISSQGTSVASCSLCCS